MAALIRDKLSRLDSHFENGLIALGGLKRANVGRSVSNSNEQEDDMDIDKFSRTFVQRKLSLNEAQWEEFCARENLFPDSDLSRASGASSMTMNRNSGSANTSLMRKSAPADAGPVSRRKSLFDIETGMAVVRRRRLSVCCLPMVSPMARYYIYWSNLVLLMDLTYTAFIIPILVGFQVPDVTFHSYGCIIDFICGFLFLVDMVTSFHVGFIAKWQGHRRIILDPKAVAIFYISQFQFVVDLITVCAWIAQVALIIAVSDGTASSSSTVVKTYQIIRVLRLFRFATLLHRLFAAATAAHQLGIPGVNISHAHAYFFNVCYGGMVLINFLACVWNFTAQEEGFDGTWVNFYPPFYRKYASPDNTSGGLTASEAALVPGPYRYLISAYYVLVTVGTVGYGDVLPATVAETFISMLCIFLGLIFFGIIIGSIADALQRMSKDAKQAIVFRDRMETVDKWMSHRTLPRRLRTRIANFYAEDWLHRVDGSDEVSVMAELPYSLRKEVSLSVNLPLFDALNMFKDFPEAVQGAIAAIMSPVVLPAGFELCEEGDLAESFWILHEGEVAAVTPSAAFTLRAPALVGQTALLQEQQPVFAQHPATYKTYTTCLLWEVPLHDVLPLLHANPTLYALAVQQALPGSHFDYLAINPVSAIHAIGKDFSGAEEDAMAIAGNAIAHGMSYGGARGNGKSSGDGGGKSNGNDGPAKPILKTAKTLTRSDINKIQLKNAKSGKF